MSLSRAWAGKLSAASLAALLVPGAMLAALALLVIAGGFGGVGSLGQAFTGPSLPAAGGLPPAPRSAPAAAAAELAARSAAPTPAPAPARVSAARSPSVPTSGGAPSAPSRSSLGNPASVSRPAPIQAGATGGPATPPPSSSAPPSHQSTIVDPVVNAGKSVAKQLPEPLGSAAAQALQSAGSTADQAVPPPPTGSLVPAATGSRLR